MIKVTVNRNNTDETKDFFYHERWEIVFQYIIAALEIVLMAISLFSFKDIPLAMFCLLFSFESAQKAKELKRENLLIDFVVDLSQALNEKEQKGSQQ